MRALPSRPNHHGTGLIPNIITLGIKFQCKNLGSNTNTQSIALSNLTSHNRAACFLCPSHIVSHCVPPKSKAHSHLKGFCTAVPLVGMLFYPSLSLSYRPLFKCYLPKATFPVILPPFASFYLSIYHYLSIVHLFILCLYYHIRFMKVYSYFC